MPKPALLLVALDGSGEQACVALDGTDARHVARALVRHQEVLRLGGEVQRDGLREALRVALLALSEGGPALRGTQGDSGAFIVWEGLQDCPHVDRDFLSRAEIVERCGASRATIDRWIGSGQLRSCKRGRRRFVHVEDLDEFLARRER